MSRLPTVPRRRVLWITAAAALAVVGVGGVVARSAAADPVLPPLTPAELLAKVAAADVEGMSATFEQRSDLGLPTLPSVSSAGGDEVQSALTMLTGNHTIRVWLSRPDQAKVALVDGDTESSVIRNGDEVWQWSSASQEAKHATLDAKGASAPTTTPTSPTEAIRKLLAAVEPTTDVTTSGTGTVAGRSVYQLVLTPKDDASLVGQVRVSVDATEFVPLAARVIADDGSNAIDLTATSVDFTRPAAGIFAFTPPPGAEVTEVTAPEHTSKDGGKVRPDASTRKTVGEGWTTVVVAKQATDTTDDPTAKALLESLPEVSGTWGHGRLLSTTLVNVVITDDGRVAAGSVTPERLYAALATK